MIGLLMHSTGPTANFGAYTVEGAQTPLKTGILTSHNVLSPRIGERVETEHGEGEET